MKKILLGLFVLTGCSAKDALLISQQLTCYTQELRADTSHEGNTCMLPENFASMVDDYQEGRSLKLAFGAPAPLFRISLSRFAKLGSHMEVRLKSSYRVRQLFCRPADPTPGITLENKYDCEFEDGMIEGGEWMLTQASLLGVDCDGGRIYKTKFSLDSTHLCDNYVGPQGFPRVDLSVTSMGPINQRLLELQSL